MSVRQGAPYADRVEDSGRTLIYEGHDEPKREGISNPKMVDQPMHTPKGTLTQNGRFYEAARAHARGEAEAELVRVYEKIKDGIWVYNGIFRLIDARRAADDGRKVFKFKLELTDLEDDCAVPARLDLVHNRMIPSWVKLEVWRRDKGRCVECGSRDNLHYDHDLPYSKGGTSLLPENVRLLCARHNLQKGAKIQ
ncbi:MAG: HNH endonuclease [Armatimonadota bacterium]